LLVHHGQHPERHLVAPVPCAPDQVVAQGGQLKRRRGDHRRLSVAAKLEEAPVSPIRIETQTHVLGVLGVEQVDAAQEHRLRRRSLRSEFPGRVGRAPLAMARGQLHEVLAGGHFSPLSHDCWNKREWTRRVISHGISPPIIITQPIGERSHSLTCLFVKRCPPRMPPPARGRQTSRANNAPQSGPGSMSETDTQTDQGPASDPRRSRRNTRTVGGHLWRMPAECGCCSFK
jgi:hypothetical protein